MKDYPHSEIKVILDGAVQGTRNMSSIMLDIHAPTVAMAMHQPSPWILRDAKLRLAVSNFSSPGNFAIDVVEDGESLMRGVVSKSPELELSVETRVALEAQQRTTLLRVVSLSAALVHSYAPGGNLRFTPFQEFRTGFRFNGDEKQHAVQCLYAMSRQLPPCEGVKIGLLAIVDPADRLADMVVSWTGPLGKLEPYYREILRVAWQEGVIGKEQKINRIRHEWHFPPASMVSEVHVVDPQNN